ncbi:hypothetical protein RJD24_14060 [Bacillaceae bacterium IKA-2]|nr:hypothetical protein RJD24_14060 [Bacillaceae bacterium IKA-2]
MDIVTIEQCLQQLNSDVKTKIINKQDELLGVWAIKCLHERLNESEFRKKLISQLSSKERKYLFSCIQDYSPYLKTVKKEEEVATIEKKLTLLFLRQKGLLFKLDEKKHYQAYVIPVEIVESYFELTFKDQKDRTVHTQPLATRKYLYYLMELIIFLKTRGLKQPESFQLLKEEISTCVNWDMLLRFLEHVGLVESHQGEYVVKNKQCDIFFQQSNQDIKLALAIFCITDFIETSFSKSFLIWVLFHNLGEGVALKQIVQYLNKNNQDVDIGFDRVIEQLIIVEIVYVTEMGIVFFANEEVGEVKKQQGMEVTIGQFLVPVYIRNDALWTFRCWGTFQDWDLMIQIGFSEASFRHAILEERQLESLLRFLTIFLPEITITRWKQTFEQWQKKAQPIVKKQNVTLYLITEAIYINFVEEHWHNWWKKADHGIIIEKQFELSFEDLLEKLELNVITEKFEVTKPKERLLLSIINEFPKLNSIIPEVEKLPKQWFTLTFYDEKTMQRIAKQAIVLKLSLQIEIDDQEIIKLFPLKLSVNNGCYEISCQDTKKFSLRQIKKIAIVHPIQ